MGVPLNASLSDICTEGVWNIRPARSDRQLCIQTFLTSINLSNDADSTEWIVAIGLSSRLEQLLNMAHCAQPDPLKGQTDIMWLNGGPHLRPLQSGGDQNSLLWSGNKLTLYIHRQCFKPYTSIITTIDRTTRNWIHSKLDINPGQSSQMIRFWFSDDLRSTFLLLCF
ncbi:hypothetical protein IGI04_040622 [Brassica rapa subsp. trilocularis]|uniref:Anaphase-promoting complex subunit 1 n=1 Tax=Brassica rapa subsp. trilocularis TaxID=1813537 RepID=A0ABQ7KSG1_BRACM|nr:hypothetical protein IGI04_040622 [Brassica rapa subsp. trilocularis]